jgi:CysZ protein
LTPAARPSALRRAAAGAFHVPAGFWYLLRRPRLWPLSALPSLLGAVSLISGLALGLYSFPALEKWLVPDRVSPQLRFALTLALAIGAVAAGLALGLALALLLAAPILERLSRRVEREEQPLLPQRPVSLGFEIMQSLRTAAYFVAASPLVFLLSLIPLVGPPLGMLWGGYCLSFQQTEISLVRRGLDFRARRLWHRRFRAESIGFGLTALVTLVVPLANFILAPALAVGGTLLVLALEEEPETASDEPTA